MATTDRGAESSRLQYVDLFRGLLMAHMALDHASLFYNPWKFGNEFASGPMPVPGSFWQFIARFTGVFVAPGFSFMAGYMVAITSASREERGRDPWTVTRRLIVRGLVLIGAEALVFSLPFGAFHFEVLSCLGVCLILVALARRAPTSVLLPVALGILFFHMQIDLKGLGAMGRILHEPAPYAKGSTFDVLYPVIPWVGVMLLGLLAGRDAAARPNPVRLWWGLSIASFVLFFVVRMSGGYGNAYPGAGVGSFAFWTFAKYPPDLAWLAFSFGVIFALLAGLRTWQDQPAMKLLAPVRVIGRVPFFFYLLHFILLFLSTLPFKTDASGHVPLGLAGAVVIWLAVVALLLPACTWYSRMKTERPNLITRYL
jgi:uncharacterized membrane protein